MNDIVHQILPYSAIVGQSQLKLALELTYIAPRLGGVLITGSRGTGKSTAVRAFSRMIHGGLPITIPINATEDRVVGGWKIDQLMRKKAEIEPGLLEEADGTLLYIDEINLLDDHIVNIGVTLVSLNSVPARYFVDAVVSDFVRAIAPDIHSMIFKRRICIIHVVNVVDVIADPEISCAISSDTTGAT